MENSQEMTCEEELNSTIEFERFQNRFAKYVIANNCGITSTLEGLNVVGGLDISFRKCSNKEACVALAVFSYPSLKELYAQTLFVEMTQPYQSGFLGFREFFSFEKIMNEIRKNKSSLVPQVVLIDGNGILHARRFGSASHFGLGCDIPTIGVAKNLITIPELGICADDSHKEQIKELKNQNDSFSLVTNANEVVGMALLTGSKTSKPVYVSVGHKCDLETAVKIVSNCSPRYRVPEPIRRADILSREKLREKYPSDR